MASRILLLLLPLLSSAQQVGTYTAEVHPRLTWQKCNAYGCTTVAGKIVVDSNSRWIHSTSSTTNCFTGNIWDSTLCPDPLTCTTNCALDGADYEGTYGITTSGNSLRLNFVTASATQNVGSRVYLMADDNTYETFNMLNQEFSFDVDVSNLPCGLNGALYMTGMIEDGGMAQYPTNKAGAKYGTGYCDAQCPRDLKFINGQANVDGWTPSSNNPDAGIGNHGSCCAEMDIWEANSISAVFAAHSADNPQQTECTAPGCGGAESSPRYGGTTDPDGCDFNSYRMGNTTFYGPGRTVNTNSTFTVITQFLTSSNGTLSEIKRFYVQNGVLIPNSQSEIKGVTGNSITTAYCTAEKIAFNDPNSFAKHGGLGSLSKAFQDGMVLAMSLTDDYYTNNLWLDSSYPTTANVSTPGVGRGTCSPNIGSAGVIQVESPDAYVVFGNIKIGPINSTATIPV